MRSAIILVLALCIGCKERTAKQFGYVGAKYGAAKDTVINDTLYVAGASPLDEPKSMVGSSAERAGWGFTYGTMNDTSFVTVMHGVTLVSYKKGDSVWHITDSSLWKRFLDTIEVIRESKKNVPAEWRTSGSIKYIPPLGHDAEVLEKDLQEFERLFGLVWPKTINAPFIDFGCDTTGAFPQSAINFYNDNGAAKERSPKKPQWRCAGSGLRIGPIIWLTPLTSRPKDTIDEGGILVKQIFDNLTIDSSGDRYYYVTCQVKIKSTNRVLEYMDAFLTHRGHFSKREFDSVQYESLSREKSCYSKIKIVSVYETDRDGYETTTNIKYGYKPDPPHKRKHLTCCEHDPNDDPRIGGFSRGINFFDDTTREKEPRVQPTPAYYFGDPPWDTAHFGADSTLTWDTTGLRLYIGGAPLDTPMHIWTSGRAEKDSFFIFRWHGHECTVRLKDGKYWGFEMRGQTFETLEENDAFWKAFNRKLDSLGLNKGRYESWFIEDAIHYWGKGKEDRQ